MYIEKYEKKRHIKVIGRFLHERSIDQDFLSLLPEHGYIAYLDDHPIACGFLRKCEGGIGIVDSFCSNPKMPGQLRHQALDLIINKLVRDCKELNIKGLIAFSSDSSIIQRSLRHNFMKLDQQVMTLFISK